MLLFYLPGYIGVIALRTVAYAPHAIVEFAGVNYGAIVGVAAGAFHSISIQIFIGHKKSDG